MQKAIKNAPVEADAKTIDTTEILPSQNSIVNFNVESLIFKAIEHGLSPETMEKFLTMRQQLKAEWAKEQYDKAMAKFQSECPTITKTKVVKTNSGAIAYRYAPIESIIEQIKSPLQVNGFSYSTRQEMLQNTVKISVKVTHTAGHSELTDMTVPLGGKTSIMSDTQVVAAASTFAKRYALTNAFGIMTADEDDDAVSTKVEFKPTERIEPTESTRPPRTIAKGFIDRLQKAFTVAQYTEISEQVKSSRDNGMLTKEEFALILQEAKETAKKIETLKTM